MTLNELLTQCHQRYQAAGNPTMTISNEFAAELVAQMRARVEARDETVDPTPADPIPLLILKLYDEVEAIKKGTAFLGVGGGIKAPTRVAG